jgi:hypothetical protein
VITPDDPRHGTSRGYVLGCRLDCCRRAQMVYMKRYRMGQTPKLIDPTGTIRRIRALHCMGYSSRELGAMVGKGVEWTRQLAASTVITTTNAALVADLYDRLSMTPAAHELADRIRRESLAKGWLPPLAWDDIDDPAESPRGIGRSKHTKHDIDPIVVERVLSGERLRMTSAERREVVQRARGMGWTLKQIEARTGVAKPERYVEREAS